MRRSFRFRYVVLIGLLGIVSAAGSLLGCSNNKELSAAPIGTPTNPPPPRLEGHSLPNAPK